MDLYSLLLFAHIAFAIVWLGSGVMLHVLAIQFDRASDALGLEKLFRSVAVLGNTMFMPSALVVLATGLALTIDGPWSFGALWIVLALIGFALTFMMGTFWLGPQSEKIKEIMERDGGMTTVTQARVKRMLTVARIDTVILFVIVFDMSIKPTGSDTGALVVMGAALVAAFAFFTWKGRAVEIGPAEPDSASPA